MQGRHNRLADDSRMMSCIIPERLFRSMKEIAQTGECTFSDIVRRALFAGERILRRRMKLTEDAR